MRSTSLGSLTRNLRKPAYFQAEYLRRIGPSAAKSTAYPDDANYSDDGCFVHPSCLSCPLARCIEEFDRPQTIIRNDLLNIRILALSRRGLSAAAIATRLSVSRRTVFRFRKRLPVILLSPTGRPVPLPNGPPPPRRARARLGVFTTPLFS